MRTSPKFPVNLPSMYSSVLASCKEERPLKQIRGHSEEKHPVAVMYKAQVDGTGALSGLPADSCRSPRIPDNLHHQHV